jgi:hypothetical protein
VLRSSFFATAAASRPCAATCDREMAARMPSPPSPPRLLRAEDGGILVDLGFSGRLGGTGEKGNEGTRRRGTGAGIPTCMLATQRPHRIWAFSWLG